MKYLCDNTLKFKKTKKVSVIKIYLKNISKICLTVKMYYIHSNSTLYSRNVLTNMFLEHNFKGYLLNVLWDVPWRSMLLTQSISYISDNVRTISQISRHICDVQSISSEFLLFLLLCPRFHIPFLSQGASTVVIL